MTNLLNKVVKGWVIEHKFHQKRKWKFDFANPKIKIAVEKEGGVWLIGRHNRGKGFLNDMEKYNEAAIMGWRVLRYPPDKILNAIHDIQRML